MYSKKNKFNIELFKKKKIQLNKIGFHAHDNTGCALKNSLAAIHNGFGIVDTSVMGMGRGAGNLDLINYLNFQGLNKEKKLLKFLVISS